MDLRATKTTLEREDEEAERLVRPAPKQKPPRHDRRRELMQTDQDPDTDGDPDVKRDPDGSRNYKDVGGSTKTTRDRVLLRLAASEERIPARSRETGKVVLISPNTLKERPGEYELVKDKDEKPSGEDSAEKPESSPQEDPKPKNSEPSEEEVRFQRAGDALREMAKDNPRLTAVFRSILDPQSNLGGVAKANPNFQAAAVLPGVQLPEGVSTLGDLRKALESQPKAKPSQKKPRKPKAEPKAQPQPEEPKAEDPKAEEAKPSESPKGEEAPKDEETKSPKEPEEPKKTPAQEVVERWLQTKGQEKPEFQRYLDSIPSTDKDPSTGRPLVLDPKSKKKVPFESLPVEAQKNLIDSFTKQREEETNSKAKALLDQKRQEQAATDLEKVTDSQAKEILADILDPKSDVAKRLKEIGKEHDLGDVRADKVFPELAGKLPEHLNNLKALQGAAQDAKAHSRASLSKSEAFQAYVEELPTSERNEKGDLLVLDPKSKKKVPLDRLPEESRTKLIDSFSKEQESREKAQAEVEKAQAQEARGEALRKEIVQVSDPDAAELLASLSDPNSEASQKIKALSANNDLAQVRADKVFPELAGKLPKGLSSLDDVTTAVSAYQKHESKSEFEKAGLEPPPRRPYTESESFDADQALKRTFPPKVAAALMGKMLHPDDAHRLIETYEQAKTQKVSNVNSFVNNVRGFYETDVDRVKAPAKWPGPGGKLVAFDKLSDEDKAEAFRQHQLEVVASSLAAKDQLSSALSLPSFTNKPRVPQALRDHLATSMLQDKSPEDSSAKAREVFEETLTSGTYTPIKEGVVRKLLSKLKGHPGAKEVAKGYLYANDYQEAKDKFLTSGGGVDSGDSDEEEPFSEWDHPSAISRGIRKAKDWFKKKAKVYGDSTHPGGSIFKVRVMHRLRNLAPEKFSAVRTSIDESDANDYESSKSNWQKQHKDWEERQKKREQASGKGTYRDKPPPETDDPEPEPPVKPARYDIVRPPKTTKARSVAQSVADRVKTASLRECAPVSSYLGDHSMGHVSAKSRGSDRAAVYHGIDPKKNYPGSYPEWEQAHQRDLDDADVEKILASARKWMRAPSLAGDIHPDTKARAALDLALRTGPYDKALHPNMYNDILARLAGVPAPGKGETLLTLRGKAGSDVSPCSTPGEVIPMKSSDKLRKLAAVAANTNPSLAYDMLSLATKLAADEDKKQGQDDEQESDEQKGQSKQGGEMPPQFRENAEKKKEEAEAKKDESKDSDEGQKKEAAKYAALRAVVIRTAAMNTEAKSTLLPVLQAIKQLG